MRVIALAALAATVAGCGAVAGDDFLPPLVRLRGVVTESRVDIRGTLRGALVWLSYDLSKVVLAEVPTFPITPAVTSQDVAIEPRFPSSFAVDVTRLPPPGALTELFDASLTFGVLVVYDDTDGDGRLDLASIDPPAMGERVVGAAAEHALVYVERRGAPVGLDLPVGFHLVRGAATAIAATPPPACDEPDPPPEDGEELPPDTPIELRLDGASGFGGVLCAQHRDDPDLRCEPAPGAAVTCNRDGSGYVTTALLARGTPCEQRIRCAVRVCIDPPEPLDACAGR